jgi:hypothetical protein
MYSDDAGGSASAVVMAAADVHGYLAVTLPFTVAAVQLAG